MSGVGGWVGGWVGRGGWVGVGGWVGGGGGVVGWWGGGWCGVVQRWVVGVGKWVERSVKHVWVREEQVCGGGGEECWVVSGGGGVGGGGGGGVVVEALLLVAVVAVVVGGLVCACLWSGTGGLASEGWARGCEGIVCGCRWAGGCGVRHLAAALGANNGTLCGLRWYLILRVGVLNLRLHGWFLNLRCPGPQGPSRRTTSRQSRVRARGE